MKENLFCCTDNPDQVIKTVLWATILHACGICFVTLHSCAVLTFIQDLCQFCSNKDSKYSCWISTAMKEHELRQGDTNKVRVWARGKVKTLDFWLHEPPVNFCSSQSSSVTFSAKWWCFVMLNPTLSIKVIPEEHSHLKTCFPCVSPAINKDGEFKKVIRITGGLTLRLSGA